MTNTNDLIEQIKTALTKDPNRNIITTMVEALAYREPTVDKNNSFRKFTNTDILKALRFLNSRP